MNIAKFFSHFLLQEHAVNLGKTVLLTFVLIMILWYVHKLIHKAITCFEDMHQIDPTLARALQQIVLIIFYCLSGILLLENLNIEISNVLKTLGIVIVGLGIASQQILANATAGIFLLIYKSFGIGDYIICEAPKFEGKIIDINLRHTTLDNKGDLVVIPNQTLYTATVTIKKT